MSSQNLGHKVKFLEKPCELSRKHNCDPVFMELCSMKSMSDIEKPCEVSRRHSFDPAFMKLCQNVSLIYSGPDLKLGHVGLKIR